jgi:dienelactone hydrolase
MKVAGFAAALAAAATMTAAPAQAQDLPPVDPAFLPEGVQQYEKGRNRGFDQARNPEFMATAAPIWATLPDNPASLETDPYRVGWNRGVAVAVEIPNRYGVKMRATLFAPKEAAKRRGRAKRAALPAVIVLNGGAGAQEALWAHLHGLAEAGYVALGLDVQGDGRTANLPADPAFCQPGAWQEPQEMGIREQHACAGQRPPDPDPTAGPLGAPGYYQVSTTTQQPDYDQLDAGYAPHVARKVFGALDAVKWLLSSANPLRSKVHRDRIGVMGHSLGAHGALVAGNGDPLERFAAVVSLDGFGRLAPYATPRVPTLFLQHEIDMGLPKHHRPDDTITPSHQAAQAFRAANVPTMLVTPDGSTHLDFAFLSYPPVWPLATATAVCPECVGAVNASRDGERVSLHYTTAWFDRYLKHDKSAEKRLLATTFDASSDRSSIGQGQWDPTTQRNVPYTIGGETVRSHLSPLFRSFADLGPTECTDLREGC